jgi:hypothetical protein
MAGNQSTHYYTLLPHPFEVKLLLLSGPEGWALPHWSRADRPLWHTTGPVNEVMRKELGVETTVLRLASARQDPATQQMQRVYALENHSPDWRPPADARWVGEEVLAQLRLAVPEHRPLLETWFAETRRIPSRRAPWAQPGWFVHAAGWVREEAERAGRAVNGPIEQVRNWQRSCILRARTDRGEVYFKAVPPMFAVEPPLTRGLAQQYPDHLPPVLAIDPDRHWLLTQGVVGKTLDQFPDIRHWEMALRTYAGIQIDQISRVDGLRGMGCPDHPLATLSAAIPSLVTDPAALQPGQEHGLSAAEIDQLQALAPQLQRACDTLDGWGVPETVEHGDFYAWQILIAEERPVFIDWSDCSVSHPFFSLLLFFAYGEMEQHLPAVPAMHARLRDAYLEPWTAFAPIERLRPAFDLAQVVAPLHHALIYQQQVMPNLEDPAEWEAMAPWVMKMVLAQRVSGDGVA